MRYSARKMTLALIAGCLLAVMGGSPLFGQKTFNLDFNDPDDPRVAQILFFNAAELIPDGGVGDSGYLKVTDANNGESGAIVFPDFSDPPGSALESFRITADLRVGAGTERPADGFSFNLIRPDDPLIADIRDPDTGELDPQGSLGQYAASPVNEANLPEEGSQTGLGIGFDEWQSGGADPEQNFAATGVQSMFESEEAPSCGPSSSLTASMEAGRDRIEHDCIGISIRVDDELIAQAPFPTLNGELTDQNSLQTGPRGDVFDLGWATLSITVTPDFTNEENSFITIEYKDRVVLDRSIPYQTTPGQLLFGGRTGGANSNHHIDNITIITDFTRVLLGDFDEDGDVDVQDFTIMASNMNTSDKTFQEGDIDFNGRINLADFVTFRREFAKSGGGAAAAAVPEPGSVLLAGFGLLGLALRRRRRA